MSFDPNAKAKIVAVAEAPVAPVLVLKTPSGSDAERIAAARERHIECTKAFNRPGATYGWEYPAIYYQSAAGPQTSYHDFDHACFLLDFLDDSNRIGDWQANLISMNGRSGHYDLKTTFWTCKFSVIKNDVKHEPSVVSLAQVKDALAARIKELGISEVLLAEYFASALEPDPYAFSRLPFSEKMKRFQEVTQ